MSTQELLAGTLAAFGTMIVLSSLYAAFTGRNLLRVRIGKTVSLEEDVDRLRFRPSERPRLGFFERAVLAPIADWFIRRGGARGGEVEKKLDLLFYPPGYENMREFYMRKVFYTLVGFGMGFLIVFLFSGTIGVLSLVFPPLFAYIGFTRPESTINAMMKERAEVMTFEIKNIIDRLLIAIQTKNSLNAAIVDLLSGGNVDGYIAAELRRAMNLSMRGMPLDQALVEAQQRCVDVPLVANLFFQLAYSFRYGTDLVRPLREASDIARDELQNALVAKGKQNEILMLLPLVIPLGGVAVAMAGPALYMFLNAFQ